MNSINARVNILMQLKIKFTTESNYLFLIIDYFQSLTIGIQDKMEFFKNSYIWKNVVYILHIHISDR